MPKVITSPIKQWQGTVTLYDPLTLPQAEKIEEAIDILGSQTEAAWYTVGDKAVIPALLACVETWELQDFPYKDTTGLKAEITADTFPFSPRKASHQLINWLWDEIRKVYIGEQEVPNG